MIRKVVCVHPGPLPRSHLSFGCVLKRSGSLWACHGASSRPRGQAREQGGRPQELCWGGGVRCPLVSWGGGRAGGGGRSGLRPVWCGEALPALGAGHLGEWVPQKEAWMEGFGAPGSPPCQWLWPGPMGAVPCPGESPELGPEIRRLCCSPPPALSQVRRPHTVSIWSDVGASFPGFCGICVLICEMIIAGLCGSDEVRAVQALCELCSPDRWRY